MVSAEVVCLGPTGSGKTTLLSILQNKLENGTFQSEDSTDQTTVNTHLLGKSIPTIGANNFVIHTHRVQSYLVKPVVKDSSVVDVKEYGGELAPNWTSYLKRYSKLNLIYVIDCSDATKIGETAVHLVDIVEQAGKQQSVSNLLIVYSKIDRLKIGSAGSDFDGDCVQFDRKRLTEYRQLLRIQQLKAFAPRVDIFEVEYSAVNGQGLPEIRLWLQNL